MKNIGKISKLVLAACAVLSSCTYDESDTVGSAGDSFIRVVASPDADSGFITSVAAFDASPGTATFLEIRRDAVSSADLAATVTATFTIDNSIVDSYNHDYVDVYNDSVHSYNNHLDSNGDGIDDLTEKDTIPYFDIVDASLYSFATQTVTFQPGEFSVLIPMTLDPTALSFSKQYALGVTLGSPSGAYKVSELGKDIFVKVVVKNQFDGKYSVDGTLTDMQVATIDGSCVYPYDVYMITNGSKQVNVFDLHFSDYYHLICSDGGANVYGAVAVVFNFDADNNVVSVDNYYDDPAPRHRWLELDPSGVNKFDPDTKTLKVKYWLNQDNGTQPHRTYFDETYTYKGPR